MTHCGSQIGTGYIASRTGEDRMWFLFPQSCQDALNANWPSSAESVPCPEALAAATPETNIFRSVGVLHASSFDTVIRMANLRYTPFRQCNLSFAIAGPVVEIADNAQTAQAPQTSTAVPSPAPAQTAAVPTEDVSGIEIKNGYTLDYEYCGQQSYHSYHATGFNRAIHPDKPWRVGIELELYARNEAAKRTILGASSNWFQCERDGSLTESIDGRCGLGIEMKTIPLRACDARNIEFWREPMTRLKQLAVSCGHTTTGLHVHIGKEIFGRSTPEIKRNIANLNFFYVHVLSADLNALAVNDRICGRTQGYGGYTAAAAESDLLKSFRRIAVDGDIKPFINALNETAQNEIRSDLNEKCRNQRWDINIKNLDTYGTVEFRKGDGRISATRVSALVSWWESMILYCKETPWREMNFEDFRRRACAESPSVAALLLMEDEA